MSHTRATKPSAGASRSTRIITYGVLAVAVVILMVTGLLVYQSGKSSREAEDKADQLVAQLAEFGLRTPTKDQIVRVLGDDGGAVCANPGSPLTRAALAAQLSNGAGGPGMRPVIADTRFLQGELAILSVYCPDQLGKVKEYVDSLRTGEVAG